MFWPFPNPKNSPLGPQKVKNDPKIESKSNVRIERNKENESGSTTWVDPKSVVEPYPNPKLARKTVFEPYPNPINIQLGTPKVKSDPKIKSKSNVRIEGYIENETHKPAHLSPRKTKMTPNLSQIQMSEFRES